MYIDYNNLYGDSLSKYLPFRNWIYPKSKYLDECKNIIVNNKDNKEEGYIFEIDLKYPDYDKHKD